MDIDELIKNAEAGDAEAQYKLGNCYYKGDGVKKDIVVANQWYRKAAEQGHAGAQFYLGGSYEGGWGVNQSYTEAFKWTKKAAEQGFTAAQSTLGYCYYVGMGVVSDLEEALRWYRIAAEKGDECAIDALKKIRLNKPSGMQSERARINLNETNIFHYDSYAIWVHSEDHNPPHFHIRSKDNWDVCFYIQDGELYKVKSEGDNEQTFSYIMDNVKKWLSSESARVKGYTNQVNAMLAWDEIHDTHDFFDYPPQVPPQR